MIIIATNNNHKLDEYKNILGNSLHIKSTRDFGVGIEPEENGHTLVENAYIKAKATYDGLLHKGIIKENDYVVADIQQDFYIRLIKKRKTK